MQRGLDAQVGLKENVYAAVTRHRDSCKLVDAGAHGLWLPDSQCDCGAFKARYSTYVIKGHNVITTAGDVFYAQKGCSETPTNNFNRLTITTSNASTPSRSSNSGNVTAPPTGGTKSFDSTYPKTADADTDNPAGTGVTDRITYRASYGTGDANATLEDVAIHKDTTTLGSGTDPLLMHATITSFTKSSSDTMKLYVNHNFEGS